MKHLRKIIKSRKKVNNSYSFSKGYGCTIVCYRFSKGFFPMKTEKRP
jgi:hypothetical protein